MAVPENQDEIQLEKLCVAAANIVTQVAKLTCSVKIVPCTSRLRLDNLMLFAQRYSLDRSLKWHRQQPLLRPLEFTFWSH